MGHRLLLFIGPSIPMGCDLLHLDWNHHGSRNYYMVRLEECLSCSLSNSIRIRVHHSFVSFFPPFSYSIIYSWAYGLILLFGIISILWGAGIYALYKMKILAPKVKRNEIEMRERQVSNNESFNKGVSNNNASTSSPRSQQPVTTTTTQSTTTTQAPRPANPNQSMIQPPKSKSQVSLYLKGKNS